MARDNKVVHIIGLKYPNKNAPPDLEVPRQDIFVLSATESVEQEERTKQN